MILIYHILTTLIFFLVLPFLPLVYLLSEKRRANLLQRFGGCTGFKKKQAGAFRVWVHGLSVGEVRSALPFVLSLKKRKPKAEIIFTASTKTGFDTARQLFEGDKDALVSQIGYFPFDIWVSVLRICHLIEPDVVCLVETDIWPGFLHQMKQQKIPVVLVNARLSKRSLNGYLRMGRFYSLFFSSLSHIMAQTSLDAKRFKRVGVLETCLSTMGNIKFDQAPLSLEKSEISQLKTRFGIQAQDQIWIAGSTHEGEEKILLDAFSAVKKSIPNLKLILAPRDPKRSERIMGQISSPPHHPVLFSQLTPGKEDHDLIVLDKIGELSRTYAVCDLAFIGGSLLPFGGHNPLEPAMFGKPILFGSHMTDFIEIADLLMTEQGAHRVETISQIHSKLQGILQDPVLAKQMGDASYRVFSGNTGAVDRTLTKMEDLHFV
ncbi:MAG: 3-deoxy-D-manno-octulosonic acid transferase [Deltaproteobacteria bacterium]|nr:MAG: 3-deoxy-D-manno-octulosonic acid transferase [Deltaproteobacteria bacterium]